MGRKPKVDPDAFPRWVAAIDREIRIQTGLGSMDYPPYEYRYHYTQGKTPHQAAQEIIARSRRGAGR